MKIKRNKEKCKISFITEMNEHIGSLSCKEDLEELFQSIIYFSACLFTEEDFIKMIQKAYNNRTKCPVVIKEI